MDLRKTSADDQLILCRKYFYFGFICLPFLWLLNSIWFFSSAFSKEESDSQQKKAIKQYVIYSMIGSIVWIIAIISWIITFQVRRAEWEAFGDSLSFNIPRGIP